MPKPSDPAAALLLIFQGHQLDRAPVHREGDGQGVRRQDNRPGRHHGGGRDESISYARSNQTRNLNTAPGHGPSLHKWVACLSPKPSFVLHFCPISSWSAGRFWVRCICFPRIRALSQGRALRLSDLRGYALREEDTHHYAPDLWGRRVHPCQEYRTSRPQAREHFARRESQC